MKKRLTILLLGLAFCLSPLVALAETAEVNYYDPNTARNLSTPAQIVTQESREWESGWYAAMGEISFVRRVEISGNVNLILTDDCILTVPQGIHVGPDASLTVWGQQGQTGILHVQGYAGCAGIGGDPQEANGPIVINGGALDIMGGIHGAGIGGGKQGDGADITVNGGSVQVYGGEQGAGIGGGREGSGSRITIGGGTVYACGTNGAAGIGGGMGRPGSDITVSGLSWVTVYSLGGAAGIGGGCSSDGSGVGERITIKEKATVEAFSEGTGAAIGGGGQVRNDEIASAGRDISILDRATVTVRAHNGAGIGGGGATTGPGGVGERITLDGPVHVNASAGDGAGIGGGRYGSGQEITIANKAEVKASSTGGAGIGGGMGGSADGVYISDSTVKAQGGVHSAGIGGGGGAEPTPLTQDKDWFHGGHAVNIVISDSTVTATAGEDGTAIGGGSSHGVGGSAIVTISASRVTAIGQGRGIDIGAGVTLDGEPYAHGRGEVIITDGAEVHGADKDKPAVTGIETEPATPAAATPDKPEAVDAPAPRWGILLAMLGTLALIGVAVLVFAAVISRRRRRF